MIDELQWGRYNDTKVSTFPWWVIPESFIDISDKVGSTILNIARRAAFKSLFPIPPVIYSVILYDVVVLHTGKPHAEFGQMCSLCV